MATPQHPRPVYRNINALSDLPHYRLPWAAKVSILHRISGALLMLLLPFIVWLFDYSLTSEISYGHFASAFTAGLWIFPAWCIKLVVLALIWAFVQHLLSGVRHVWADITHSVSKEQGRVSALVVLGLTAILTLALGAKLFNLF